MSFASFYILFPSSVLSHPHPSPIMPRTQHAPNLPAKICSYEECRLKFALFLLYIIPTLPLVAVSKIEIVKTYATCRIDLRMRL